MTSQQQNVIWLLTMCILAIIIYAFHDLPEKIREAVDRQEQFDAYKNAHNKFIAEMDEYRATTWAREQEIPNAFSKEVAKTDAQANIDEWNKRADMETENAERIFSADMKYVVYISTHPNPIFQDEVIAGETEGCAIYRNGIRLIDRQSGTSRQIVAPGQDPVKENIINLIWNLESDVIYFTSYGDTTGSAGVYSCNIFTGKVDQLSDGNLVELILDEPYIGYLKILNSCFIEGRGGCHWYYAALSPDGKTEIRLTEPSMNIPED